MGNFAEPKQYQVFGSVQPENIPVLELSIARDCVSGTRLGQGEGNTPVNNCFDNSLSLFNICNNSSVNKRRGKHVWLQHEATQGVSMFGVGFLCGWGEGTAQNGNFCTMPMSLTGTLARLENLIKQWVVRSNSQMTPPSTTWSARALPGYLWTAPVLFRTICEK